MAEYMASSAILLRHLLDP